MKGKLVAMSFKKKNHSSKKNIQVALLSSEDPYGKILEYINTKI